MKVTDDSKKNIGRLGEEEDVFVTSVVKEFETAETILNPWKNDLVVYYELYKMYQQFKHYDGLAQLFVPEILRAIETIVSTLYKYVFSSDPWFEYQGRTAEDEPGAQAETQLVNWQMDEGGFKIRCQDSFRQMAITGLTVVKMSWDFQQVKRKRNKLKIATILDSVTGQKTESKQLETIDELETIRDHWLFEPVNLLGFYISDVSTPYYDIQKADWVGEEYQVPKHWLLKKIKQGWLADNHIDLIQEESKQDTSSIRQKQGLLVSSGFTSQEIGRKTVLITERWGLLKARYVYDSEQLLDRELDPDDMVECVLIMANRKYLLKLEANPYGHGQKPYLSCPYIPQSNEFTGIGACKIGRSLQEELNDTRNQVMDNKTLNLMCMWIKDRASGIKNQDLRIRPNGVIASNNVNGLVALRPPMLMAPGINIESVIKNDLRESVGAPSNLQGIAQAGVGTATESTQINSSALGRLQLTAQLYSELILKPMLVMVEYLNYQFYDQEKVIGVIGESGINFKKLAPEDITGYKNVIIKLSTDEDESPAVRRQQSVQFLTIVQQMPPPLIAYHWKMLDKIYKMFFKNGGSLEDIYPAPPGEEVLLDPKDENNVMTMGHKVQVKQGDDDKDHIEKHQKEFDSLKMMLSPVAFKLYTDHIIEHHQSLAQKIQAQAQQTQMENMAMAGAGPDGGGKKGGMVNTGQMPGASAFTAPGAGTEGHLNGMMGA